MTARTATFAEHVDAIPALVEAVVRQAADDYCAGYTHRQRDRHFHSARRFLTRADLVRLVEQSLAAGRTVSAPPARSSSKRKETWNGT